MHSKIKKALDDYKLVRSKTYEFLKTLPQEKMTWKPHDLLGTFGMQLRHMTKSQEAFVEGLKKGTIESTNKTFAPELETDKSAALKRFKQLDKELAAVVSKLKPTTKITFVDGVHGTFKVDVVTVLSYLADHEFYHQGIFTCYGRLAGMGKFTFM